MSDQAVESARKLLSYGRKATGIVMAHEQNRLRLLKGELPSLRNAIPFRPFALVRYLWLKLQVVRMERKTKLASQVLRQSAEAARHLEEGRYQEVIPLLKASYFRSSRFSSNGIRTLFDTPASVDLIKEVREELRTLARHNGY